MIRAYVRERDGSIMIAGARLGLEVERYSWMAVGGPDEAELSVHGSVQELWELVRLLGCPLELYNSRGDPVWWGFVNRLRLPVGAVEVASTDGRFGADVSLDELANSVAVVYRLPGSAGEARRTDWLSDADSQAICGIKELQIDLGEAGEDQALACRAAALEAHRRLMTLQGLTTPGDLTVLQSMATSMRPAGRPIRSYPAGGGTVARLTGKGWWHTTGWRTYSQALGLEQNEAAVGGSLRLGDDASRRQVKQTFALGTAEGWAVGRVALRLRSEGSPGDAVIASLLAPDGSALAQASFPAGTLGSTAWVEAAFNPAVALSPGVGYALRLERPGLACDPLNYYRLGVDAGLNYPRGVLTVSDGVSWFPPNPNAQLIFKLIGVEDSLAQLRRILAPGCGGQFFPGEHGDDVGVLDLPAASGLAAPLWRGQLPLRTAREEAERLLGQGASSGRRYLCRVTHEPRLAGGTTPSRRVEVWEAPEVGEGDHRLAADGRLLDPYDVPLAEGVCPAGVWVRPVGVDPGLSGAGLAPGGRQALDPGRIWVERASYEAKQGRVVW